MGTEYLECGACHKKKLLPHGYGVSGVWGVPQEVAPSIWVRSIWNVGRATRRSYFHMGTEYLECGACHKK